MKLRGMVPRTGKAFNYEFIEKKRADKSEARVRVSLTDGVLEFEGPETFVAGLVEKFTGVIRTALAGEPPGANDAAGGADGRDDAGDSQSAAASVHPVASSPPSPEVALSDIFAVFAEIARVCKAHGCYDPRNMASYLIGDRTSFVFGGTGKLQTLKLSAPGMEGTAALIARIRA